MHPVPVVHARIQRYHYIVFTKPFHLPPSEKYACNSTLSHTLRQGRDAEAGAAKK